MQNPNLPHPETKQKGYTIIELGIALAIIAVLIVAGLAGVTTVLNNSKSNAQIEESGIVLAKLQSLLTSTSASGINTAGAVGAGFFPAARVTGTGTAATVANKFGGSEFVGSNSAALVGTTEGVVAAANVGAIYTIMSVPKAVCANIATSLATLANSAWIHTTAKDEGTAGAAAGFTTASQIKAPGGQVQGAKVGTQCNSGTTDTVNLAFFLRP
jgi:prepilin-type N-terminal cleavage/methylation domain-containing protein